MIWFPPDLKKAGRLWYHLTAGSPSLELTVNARTLYGFTRTKLWCIFHVQWTLVAAKPEWNIYTGAPYLHRKRTSQLNLVEEITAFVSCLSAAIATSFSDVWLFDTALQKQELFFRGHERISSEAESWEWGNISREITEKHFQETKVLIVGKDGNDWQLNYSVRKCNI